MDKNTIVNAVAQLDNECKTNEYEYLDNPELYIADRLQFIKDFDEHMYLVLKRELEDRLRVIYMKFARELKEHKITVRY